ncbi:hypothetical protein, partial [Candidatus Thiosymbion oneisti]|uniref:hypothetical protein n=1 Tax=Candidatus Thiosymbion oneisti TaxID=589554 RepID=UPI001C40757B
ELAIYVENRGSGGNQQYQPKLGTSTPFHQNFVVKPVPLISTGGRYLPAWQKFLAHKIPPPSEQGFLPSVEMTNQKNWME